MLLEITHDTVYRYAPGVDVAQHVAHLKPSSTPTQKVLRAALDVSPRPDWQDERRDAYGNLRSSFSIQSRHDALHVTATSLVETVRPPRQPDPAATLPWEEARERFRYRSGGQWDPATEFAFPSQYVEWHADFADFARPCFTPRRPLLEAAIDLMRRIHRELKYASHSTDVNTPAREALARREGVCQDFAHVFLSCAVSLGLAARYVSGYLLTVPPEGRERLVGSDASHAWVSLWLPELKLWVDLDPTNDRWGAGSPGEDYVTLAVGRDFADVSPMRGVIRGGAHHVLEVGVTVAPVERSGRP